MIGLRYLLLYKILLAHLPPILPPEFDVCAGFLRKASKLAPNTTRYYALKGGGGWLLSPGAVLVVIGSWSLASF